MDDPDAHVALGMFYQCGAAFISCGEASPDSVAQARRHYETAVALGSARARQHLAFLAWDTDGLLAAEPYFRASVAAGNEADVEMLALVTRNRPLLARGLNVRDAPGDLSLVDIVGEVRVLRAVGSTRGDSTANRRVEQLREQAGNAEADSLLTVLGAAGLLG